MTWVSSSGCTQNKDRFFLLQPSLFVSSSNLIGVKENDLDWTFCPSKAAAFPHFTSLTFLSGCSMATSEIWGGAFKRDLSTCTSPTSLEGKTVVWSRRIPFVKNPWELFLFKIFPEKNAMSHKGKACGYVTGTRQGLLCAVNSHGSGKRLFAYFYFPSKIATVM